jgi:hypothetical protein
VKREELNLKIVYLSGSTSCSLETYYQLKPGYKFFGMRHHRG